MAKSSIMVSRNIRPKPTNQALDVGRVSTIELILSVTEPRVYPGSMTGARSFWSGSSIALAVLRWRIFRCFQFRVGIANVGQVRGAGTRVQVRQQAIVPPLRFQF